MSHNLHSMYEELQIKMPKSSQYGILVLGLRCKSQNKDQARHFESLADLKLHQDMWKLEKYKNPKWRWISKHS